MVTQKVTDPALMFLYTYRVKPEMYALNKSGGGVSGAKSALPRQGAFWPRTGPQITFLRAYISVGKRLGGGVY